MASKLATESFHYESHNTSQSLNKNEEESQEINSEPDVTRPTSSSSTYGSELESQRAGDPFSDKTKECVCSMDKPDIYITSFIKSLAAWAVEHNIQEKALNELLLILKNHPSLEGLPGDSRSLFQAARTSPSTSRLEQKTNQIAEKQDKMERTLRQIMTELREVRGLVTQSVISPQTNGYASIEAEAEREFLQQLPVTTLEDFFKLEESLKNKDKCNMLTQYLARIGGFSMEESARRIFQRLLTNEVAVHFSWLGKKGKIPLHNLTFTKVVHDVLSSAHKDVPSKNIETRISTWFRQAKTRIEAKVSKKSI